MAERTDYHMKVIGIAVGAIVVNHAGAMWAFIPDRVFEDNCKLHVFKTVFYSTGMVPLYAIASVLLPKEFAPYLVATGSLICVVITVYNFRSILISGLKWVCEKAVNGARWIPSWIRSTFTRERVFFATRWMLSNMTPPDDRVLPTTDPGPAPEARISAAEEEEQNPGGGSGLSPNLQWRSATGSASQEPPNLNEFTKIPL